MNRIIKYFIDRTFVVNLIAFFIVLFGIISFVHTRRDLIPQMEIKMISISAELLGASPVEVERQLTFPLEEAVKNVSGIKKITSHSQQSVASIMITFQSDFKNMSRALEEIKSLVQGIEGNLPSEIEPISVNQLSVDEVDAMSFSLLGVDLLNSTDRAWVSRFEEMLRGELGVVRVSSSMPKRQVFINFIPEKLRDYGLPVSHIRDRIISSLTYLPVASFSSSGESISIEMASPYSEVDKVRDIPIISTRSGLTIQLHQLANVEYRFPDASNRSLLNGEHFVDLTVYKDLNSDIIDLSGRLKTVANDFRAIVPKNIIVKERNDTSLFLSQQLTVLTNNALIGGVLVLLILYLLLGARISLVTIMGLPFAYFGTFIVLSFFNVSIDLISVVGLILVVGVLVDDAIVVSEQYVQYLEEGMNPKKAAYRAAKETIIPVSGTILTTMVAFASLLILSSEASDILFAIPCVVIASLALSWFECYFILPNHLQHFVKSKSKRTEGKIFKKMQKSYGHLLRFCLKWRYLFSLGIVLFLFFSFYIAAAHVKKEFTFSVGNEYLHMNFALNKSDSFEQTEEALRPVHQFLMSLPKEYVDHIYTSLGDVWRNSRKLTGKRYGSIYLQLPFYLKDADVIRKQLEKQIEEKFKELKGDSFEYLYVQSMVQGDEKKSDDVLTVYVSGRDRMPFELLQNEIETLVKDKNGVKEVFIDRDKFIESWRFIPDQQKLLSHGMSPATLTAQLRDIFSPQKLMDMRLEGEKTSIYSQYHMSKSPSLDSLSSFEVQTPLDVSIKTSELGKWERARILKDIEHADLLRKIEVDVRYDEKLVSKNILADQIDKVLTPLREKYPVLKFSVEKESLSEKESKQWLVKVSLLAVGLIVFILMLCLSSLTQPFVVASVIPFGVIGVIWALFLHSIPLGIMGMIGIVGMAGVVVNDSLVMVDAINRSKQGTEDYRQAIIFGAISRLRPILMTTLTTLGGVFPMAYGLGGEVGFTRPLAFTMGWGLLFTTILTLTFLPSLLLILDDFSRFFKKVSRTLLLRWKA